MIYLFDDMENIPADVISKTFSLMPIERQQRAARYRRNNDRDFSVLVYWLLLCGLKQEYGLVKPPTFTYGENKKPYIAERPDIFFNFSHCRSGVVCAVSDCEVGIDIQDVRTYNLDVAKRVCTGKELEQLAQSQEPEKLFCMLWTIKESFVKWQGKSIVYPLQSLCAHTIAEQVACKRVAHWHNDYHIHCFGENVIKKVS